MSAPQSSVNVSQNANFTSELCQFLSSLAKTPEEQYEELNLNLTRLKEALLQEVDTDSETRSKRSSESSNENSSFQSASSPSDSRPRSSTGSSSRSSPSSDDSYTASRSASNTLDKMKHKRRGTTLNNQGKRVYFSLQRGARYEMRAEEIERELSIYGDVRRVMIYKEARRGIDGHIDFYSSNSANIALNKTVILLNQCQIFTLKDWSELSEVPEPKQILLESRYLPNVWEKEMVLRSFFNKFGCVRGVVFLGYKTGDVQRFVIIFRDEQSALDLIGSSVKILSSTVFIKEVTNKTVFF